MGRYPVEKIRTIVLLGYAGAGKTSLADAMIYNAGASDRLGKVDDGTSIMDFEPEEIKRKITISASFHDFEWNKHLIHIIDTPGYPNFETEAKTVMRAADGVVLTISAISGIKVQTIRIWDYAKRLNLPGIAFVGKMDKERADFYKSVEEMERELGTKPVCVHIPIGKEADFKGYVDLISMKAFYYEEDLKGNVKEGEIPPEMIDRVEEFRKMLHENVAELDDTLLEVYLEKGELNESDLKEGLRNGTISGRIIPVFTGSPVKNFGVRQLMDAIVEYLPSPVERGVIRLTSPITGEKIERRIGEKEPFSAFVIKTIADPFAGKLSIFRVFSGVIQSDTMVYNPGKQVKERIGQVFKMEGKRQVQVDSLGPGEIGAVAKLKDTSTGDTLCDEKSPVIFEGLEIQSPVISYAIQPRAKGDEEKIVASLNRLTEEDPSIKVFREPQTKEVILSGMGQVHLEVVVERLKRKFGVDVDLKTPKVPYKETIKGVAQVQGKYKRQSGGRGQYGDVWIKMEPLPRGAGFEFVDAIVGGAIPKNYIPAVEKGIVEAMQEGVLAGYPVVDFKVTLYDGSYHIVDSSDLAFKIAASMAFKKGMTEAKPVLLEPIMSMEIIVPDECVGDIIGDLNARRGRVVGVEAQGGSQIIKALVPMAEILKYDSDLTSLTSARGSFTVEFSHYEEVPSHIAEKIIAEAKKEKEKEKEKE